MEFKKLEIDQEPWWKRTLKSPHTKRTSIYMIVGAVVGIAFFYFTDGKNMNIIEIGDITRSALLGAGFGFFVTNSPCARNKC